jgi:hypothetical protein
MSFTRKQKLELTWIGKEFHYRTLLLSSCVICG